MNKKVAAVALLLVFGGLVGCMPERYTQNRNDHQLQRDTLRMMKQEDVIALAKAGVSDSLIIATMDATDSWFQIKAQDVLDLRNAGVSEKVIGAMMVQSSEPSSEPNNTPAVRYYDYPYWSYYGYYPFSYYPSFSVRAGYRSHRPIRFRHGRF
jgi:hypothetical protein